MTFLVAHTKTFATEMSATFQRRPSEASRVDARHSPRGHIGLDRAQPVASKDEWAEILRAAEAARDSTSHGGDAAVIMRLANHQVWSFRLIQKSA
jgi:hypothetical protein